MSIEDAIKKRITEITNDLDISLFTLCVESNITPSTIFDFFSGKCKCPKVSTIKKLCDGARISLKTFFDAPYFK